MLNLKYIVKYIVTYGKSYLNCQSRNVIEFSFSLSVMLLMHVDTIQGYIFHASIFNSDLASYDHEKNIQSMYIAKSYTCFRGLQYTAQA